MDWHVSHGGPWLITQIPRLAKGSIWAPLDLANTAGRHLRGQQEACRTRTQAASALRLAGNTWSLAGFHQPGSPTCCPPVLGSGAEGVKASLQWGCADRQASGPMAVLAMCWAVAALPMPGGGMTLIKGSAGHRDMSKEVYVKISRQW